MALFLPLFARAGTSPALRAAVGASQTVHAISIHQLFGLFRAEGRSAPPVPPFFAAGGVVAFAALLALIAAPRTRVARLADWYLFATFAVDTVDGPLRRGRPAPAYVPMAAGLGAAAARRALTA